MSKKAKGDQINDKLKMKTLERFGPSENLQVVFLLDITGSMSSQIAGVKEMVRKFCEGDQPGIDIHVWTFTEDGNSCYVSTSPEGLSGQDLISYVDNIQLGKPPGFPHVSASGGDGPENYKAAVVTLKEIFGSGHNILAFLIADNHPHYTSPGLGHFNSSEARAEIAWLQAIGYQDPDSYFLLNLVIESINITIVPILYGLAKRIHWFHQAAALTDGIILSPKSGRQDASHLARGLFAILSATQSTIQNSTIMSDINFAEECNGFEICSFDDDFEILEREPENIIDTDADYTSDPGLISLAVKGLISTAFDRFRGKKAIRRCRTVDPSIVAASVKLLATTLLFKTTESKLRILAADVEKVRTELRQKLEEHSGPTTEYEIKLLEKYFSKEALEATDQLTGTASASASEVQCIISQDSALEGILSLATDPRSTEDVTKLVQVILESTMCRLFQVSFPLDAKGDADFMDAWSSVVKGGSLSSVLSSASAMTLRDPVNGTFLDPLDRSAYNVAVILAHPNDPILSQVFKLLTALPSLYGLVQGYLVSGGLKIFPSLGPGLQASALLALANNFNSPEYSKVISQSEWELARQIIYSIHINNAQIAGDVVSQLIKNGTLNPADGLSKLIVGYIRIRKLGKSEDEHLLIIYDEISAGRVAEISRLRRSLENFQCDFPLANEIMDCLIPRGDQFNPILAYHPAEIATSKNSGWTLTVQDIQRIAPLVINTSTYARFINSWEKLCTYIFSDLTNPDPATAKIAAPSTFPSNEKLLEKFIISMFLGRRKNRYELETDGNWRLLGNEEIIKCATEEFLKIISTAYSKDFSRWNAERLLHAKSQLISDIVNIPADTPPDKCTTALSSASVSVLEMSYRLQRADVIQILEILEDSKLRTLGLIAVIGEWTTQPPSQLRRSCRIICDRFEKAGLDDLVPEITKEVMKASQCARASPPNRHGHSIDFQYPGPAGWTQEYEDRRLAITKTARKSLDNMKKFTVCVEEIMKKCDNREYSKNQSALIQFAVQAFESPQVLELNNILGKIVDLKILSEMKYDEIVESRIKYLSEKNKLPTRLTQFLVKVGNEQ